MKMKKGCTSNIKSDLEQDLNVYKKIFLLWNSENGRTSDYVLDEQRKLSEKRIRELLSIFTDFLTKEDFPVLILYTEINLEIIEKLRKVSDTHGNSISYKYIAESDASFLYQLYYTYEFSDRFSILSNEATYGTLFNFVDTGLLCMEEAAKALLY